MGGRQSTEGGARLMSPRPGVTGGVQGFDSPLAVELREATSAALRCSVDTRLFVNESEAVLNRFTRALQHVRQQRFVDEQRIFDGLVQPSERQQLVHFLIDCVRNRFLMRAKVAKVKQILTERSSQWSASFREHVATCATCATVDLEQRSSTQPPADAPEFQEKRPIAFCVEVLAICGILLPLLASLQVGHCGFRWVLLIFGLLAMIPLLIFVVLKRRRGYMWVLMQFAQGDYSHCTKQRPLGRLWAPSALQVSSGSDCEDRGRFVSFGRWWKQPWTPASLTVRVGASRSATGEEACHLEIDLADLPHQRLSADLGQDGVLTGAGLPQGGNFDGSHLLLSAAASRAGQRGTHLETWAKASCWRLDILQKVLFMLAAVGLTSMLVALTVPPGLDVHCFEAGHRGQRWPLKAVFNLDASGSISQTAWQSEKDATEAIIKEFAQVYGSEPGAVHIGVVQFASDAQLEVPLTNHLQAAVKALQNIKQNAGGTVFSKALSLCQQQLSGYQAAGAKTFDVCVLITDGQTSESTADLRRIVQQDTAVFGIFVGSDSTSSERLHDLSTCGAANHSSSCHFFASATNFQDLRRNARQVAEAVARGSDDAGGGQRGRQPPPAWLTLFLLTALPFIVWWIYLLLSKRSRIVEPAPTSAREIREPLRLHAAGMNESRNFGSSRAGSGRSDEVSLATRGS
mmetsp:Transcript_97627/g.188262  ORF Transcript_97627/g.188262 Transcript_97627/m.188262 type:complete len:687 (+) Transcript_97627:37-2097(+)